MLNSMQTHKHALNKGNARPITNESLNGLFGKLADKICSYFKHRKTLKELQLKSDQTLKDIGIERAWLDKKVGHRSKTEFTDIGW